MAGLPVSGYRTSRSADGERGNVALPGDADRPLDDGLQSVTDHVENREQRVDLPAIPQRPSSASPATSDSRTAIELVSDRLANAPVQEARAWVRLRGELLRQDAEVDDRRHQRRMDVLEGVAKAGMSLVAIGVGGGLIYAGHTDSGLFALGAGLYNLAPEFVMNFFRRFHRRGRSNGQQ